MSFKLVLKVTPLRWVLRRLAVWRAHEKLTEIGPYLDSAERMIDVGAGNCMLCQELGRRGYDVVPVDLKNLSFVDEIVPVTYDGSRLPFEKDSFDVALLVTVLHHARDPDALLADVRRVARRILVIEEIYESSFEKYFTYAIDSLFNLEFFAHPHSNRTDAEWRIAFKRLRLDVNAAVYSRSLGFLRRVTYVLTRADKRAESPSSVAAIMTRTA